MSLLILLALLFGCSQNRKEEPVAKEMDYRAAYLFSMASAASLGGDIPSADILFRMAWEKDPNNLEINKKILEMGIQKISMGLSSTADIEALVDTLQTRTSFDEDMLHLCFWLYSNTNNVPKLRQTVKLLADKYPSARNYLVQYFHEQYFHNNKDIKLLEKAIAIAGEDVESLNYIAQAYMEINPRKAISVLRKVRELKPSVEVDAIMLRIWFQDNDFESSRTLFSSYRFPEETNYMTQYFDLALSLGLYDEIGIWSTKILPFTSHELYTRVCVSAFIAKDNKLLAQLQSESAKYAYLPSTISEVNGAILADFLYGNKALIAPHEQDFYSCRDIESVVMLSLLRFSSAKEMELTDAFANDFEQRLLTYPDQGLAAYLKAYLGMLKEKGADEEYVKLKYNIVRNLIDQKRGKSEDYDFLIIFYHLEKQEEAKLEVLEAAVKQFSDMAVYKNDLGYTLLLAGKDSVKAFELISAAVALEPENPHYLDSLAWYYYLQGDYQQALTLMEIPMKMETLPSEVALHLGMIYLALKQNPEAQKYLEIAAASDDEYGNKSKALLSPSDVSEAASHPETKE